MSPRRLYVANLSKFTSELELEEAFAEHGAVVSVTLVRDQETGKAGFGFVEYAAVAGAEVGQLALNGSMLHGRLLSVELARNGTPLPADPISR